jgi:hypothetical protein
MRRLLALGALLVAAGLAAPVAAHAVSTQTIACEHLHLTYAITAPVLDDTAYPVTVSGSDCSINAAASTNVSGSGTVTFLSLQDSSLCAGGAFLECDRYSLSLSNGAAVGFTTIGPVYFQLVSAGVDIPQSVFDDGNAGTITTFGSGPGAGEVNTTCTFVNPTFSCTADGAFTWEPGI